MRPALLVRLGLLFVCLIGSSACASGTGGPDRTRDAGDRGSPDAGASIDASVGLDAAPPSEDAGSDAGLERRGLCEPCARSEQCGVGSFCARIGDASLCVPGCPGEIPICPSGFLCVDGTAIGTEGAKVCIPSGRPCCIDEDGDGYGAGGGCLGADCDDENAAVNPLADEVCNAIDDDCDAVVDGDDTECESGVCRGVASSPGTYEEITGAACTDGECVRGTVSPCGLYTCDGADGMRGVRCLDLCEGTVPNTGDSACIASAHCDGSDCLDDLPDGNACDEDTDCESSHCENGYCCAEGELCCATSADCPGSSVSLCTSPATCQGQRGDAVCSARFTCEVRSGVSDDTGCDAGTLASRCGLNLPVYCDGSVDQTAPVCATSCTSDADCVAEAHCETGVCAPDRPAGGVCARTGDCRDGLSCVDGVCCTSACTGTCEACDLPGTEGTCTAVAAGTDVDSECPAIGCDGFFDGFSGNDVCYRRRDVSAAAAVCDGARACATAELLCPLQPPSTTVQIDCDDRCESPVAGSCAGEVPGACAARADTGTQSCGIGACRREVALCEGGRVAACVAASPVDETCNGVDDDCDGAVDDGVTTTFYRDGDGDGWGDTTRSVSACSAPAGYVANGGDCADDAPSRRPGATETCNGLDDDCDSIADDSVVGAGASCDGSDTDQCLEGFVVCVSGALTCSDATSNSVEACNSSDDDCDTRVDEGVLSTFYRDADADGYGNAASTTQACLAPAGFVANATDCNDASVTVRPGAPEACNGVDDDCDGRTDEGVLVTFYRDADADGFGRNDVTVTACTAPAGHVARGNDCADADAFRRPGLAESCDLLDNDCDGTVDEGGTCRSGCIASRRAGHSYMICGLRRSFADARSICASESMRVARVDDAAENTFVRNGLDASLSPAAPEDGWIGGTDIAAEGRWSFEDGTRFWTGGPGGTRAPDVPYVPWSSGEPNDDEDGGEDCLELQASNRSWNDGDCARAQIFACERW